MLRIKLIRLIISIIVIVIPSLSFAESFLLPLKPALDSDIKTSKEEAIEIAKELLSQSGIEYDELQYKTKAGSVLLSNNQIAWIVMMNDMSDPNNSGYDLYAVIDANDGKIIELSFPQQDIKTWVLQHWIEQKGELGSWSINDRALFNWLFGNDSSFFDQSETSISCIQAEKIAKTWMQKVHADVYYNKTNASYLWMGQDAVPQFVWTITFFADDNELFLVYVSTTTEIVTDCYDLRESV